MNPDDVSRQLLAGFGIDPRTVEWYMLEHKVGRPPTLTVRHIAHRDDWHKSVSLFTRVYHLVPNPEHEISQSPR